jgi:tRNA (guanine-N7-)-methyltransferase
MSETPPRKNKVFGRRRGRPLGARRRATLETLLPKLRVPLAGPLDPFALFAPRPRAIWLEVGFGAGEHLAWQAERHPDIGLIGCEIFLDGVASLLRHVEERGLANIRVHPDDARDVLAALPDASLDRVFVLHPDPWPKTRHAARRFVNPANLDALARAMAPGAELRIATDHPVYKQWTLERMQRRDDFEWLARRAADWLERPADWPETRYEAKARREGRAPLYLRYRRR